MTRMKALVTLHAFLAFAAPAAAQEQQDAIGPPIEQGASLSGAYLAGRFADSINDFHAASEYYRGAFARDPGDAAILEKSFQLALASGALDDAFKIAERILALDPANKLARLALGVRLMKAGDYAAARTQAPPVGRALASDFAAVAFSAWAAQGAGDVDGALQILDRLGGAEWIEFYKTFHAGLIAELSGRGPEASRRLGEAFRVDPNMLRLVEAYARTEARQGRKDAALRMLDEYQRGALSSPLLAPARAAIAGSEKPAPLAATTVQGAAELLYGMGAAFARQEREGKEIGAIYLNLALHLYSEHPYAFFTLAELYNGLGQRERANEMFERISRDSPIWRASQLQIATNLDALDKTTEALQKLELLLEADYSNLDAATTLGDVLRGRKRYAEAARAYGRAIEAVQSSGRLEERHWTLYFYRGMSHERAKNWPAAEADFKKSLELSPEQALTLNYLGYSWVDQNVNLPQAIEMIRKAVELRPDDGFIVDSLGWAYYRLNRFPEAVEELERAIELQSQDPTINDHLGDAYWRVGRRNEARFQWTRALSFDPEPDEKTAIELKLRNGLADAPPAPAAAPATAPAAAQRL